MAGLMQYVSRILIISLPAVVVFLCFMPYRMRTLTAMNLRSGWQREIGLILFVVSIFGISPPREDNVHLLDRGGVQYGPTGTARSIGDQDRERTSRGQKLMFLCLRGRANSAPKLTETSTHRSAAGWVFLV